MKYYEAKTLQEWDVQNFKLRSLDRKGSYYFLNIDDNLMRYDYIAQVLTIS
jgi:hypothetical protein